MCKKLRVLFAGAAYRQTNEWVRTAAQIPTCESQLQVMRLTLLHSILTQSKNNALAYAVLFGAALANDDQQLSDGRPTGKASSWVHQFWNDLLAFADKVPEAKTYMSRGFFSIVNCPSFKKRHFKQLHSFKLQDKEPRPIRQPLRVHSTWQQDISRLIIANHCYWCNVCFASVATAKRHVRAMQRNDYTCPKSLTWFPHQLQQPKRLQCRACLKYFSRYQELADHCRAHLGEILLQEILGSSESESSDSDSSNTDSDTDSSSSSASTSEPSR